MHGELSDEAKIRKDLLWGMYADVRAHARHAETLRSNVVNFMIVVASILIAVVANHGTIGPQDLPLCLTILVIGLLGLAFAASYTELYERNRQRAVELRTALDTEFMGSGGATIASLLDEADKSHEVSRLYRCSRRVTGSTRRFWFILPTLTATAGVVLTMIAL
jgi:hypothetical protein